MEDHKFIGREEQFKIFQDAILHRQDALLIAIKGRRRIGKSTFAEELAKRFGYKFVSIQGLAPATGISNVDQIKNFAEQIQIAFGLRLTLENWNDAFHQLGKLLPKGKTLLLLDEISWMGSSEPEFAGKLKIAWDTIFKKRSNLIIVVCGSVSSWIDANILQNADFVGRVTLVFDLKELRLDESAKFWGDSLNRTSVKEVFTLLGVIGGVPRYLEEINPKRSAQFNIERLCFTPGALLTREYEQIFSLIFNRRAKTYRELVRVLGERSLTQIEVLKALRKRSSGTYSEYLNDLVGAGFIEIDPPLLHKDAKGKSPRYRLKDNYLRFYLKCIAPNLTQIEAGRFKFSHLDKLKNWASIAGYQFENIVLANRERVVAALQIDPKTVIFCGPHRQSKSSRIKNGCQIDLLIETTENQIYVVECKFADLIRSSIGRELNTKAKNLHRPRYKSVRTALVAVGEFEDLPKAEKEIDFILDPAKWII